MRTDVAASASATSKSSFGLRLASSSNTRTTQSPTLILPKFALR